MRNDKMDVCMKNGYVMKEMKERNEIDCYLRNRNYKGCERKDYGGRNRKV